MNLIEKYLAKAAGLEEVVVGQELRCKVNLVVAHDVTGPMAISQFKEIGIDKVFDQEKVVMVVDHIFPAATVQARKMHWILKDFADEFGIKNFNKGEGVIHQVLSEQYNLHPGDIIIGADSHTCTAGGYGVIGIGVGSTEVAAAMATGTVDLEVPEVIQIVLTGKLNKGVSGKDIVLTLLGRFGTDGLTDKALLLSGPGIQEISKSERMTVCNMGIEMGAMITCFGTEMIDKEIDPIVIELDSIVPMLACPFSPANTKPVSEMCGLPVTQVVVGSCTNGRLNDMEKLVKVLTLHKVHPDVNMLIIPASKVVLAEMEKRDWCRILRDAGAVITNPGCGPCFGAHQGLVEERDVVVSTTNRNFPGRMGDRHAKIYLASPDTAVETAVTGRITSPGTLTAAEVV